MKNKHLLPFILAALAAVSGSACSTKSNPADTPAGFSGAVAQKECERFFQCQQGSAQQAAVREQFPISFCTEANAESIADVQAYLAAGTVRYDAAAAEACLASYSTICAGGNVPACDNVLVGLLADGASCADDQQCVSGVCGNSGAGACGACEALIADGSPCNTGAGVCGPNSGCPSGSSAMPVCTPNGVYTTTQVALGASCASVSSGQNHAEYFCAPGTYCDATEHCAARTPAGVACDLEIDSCSGGTVCANNGTDTRCRTVAATSTVGAACGSTGTTFTVCNFASKLYCGPNSTCVELAGAGALGADCFSGADCTSTKCLGGDGITGTCVAGNLADGVICEDDVECASASCQFDGNNRVCAAIMSCH